MPFLEDPNFIGWGVKMAFSLDSAAIWSAAFSTRSMSYLSTTLTMSEAHLEVSLVLLQVCYLQLLVKTVNNRWKEQGIWLTSIRSFSKSILLEFICGMKDSRFGFGSGFGFGRCHIVNSCVGWHLKGVFANRNILAWWRSEGSFEPSLEKVSLPVRLADCNMSSMYIWGARYCRLPDRNMKPAHTAYSYGKSKEMELDEGSWLMLCTHA